MAGWARVLSYDTRGLRGKCDEGPDPGSSGGGGAGPYPMIQREKDPLLPNRDVTENIRFRNLWTQAVKNSTY